jgi:hypothetical protein
MVSLNELGAAAMAIVVASFMIGIGASVLLSLNNTQTSTGAVGGAGTAATTVISNGIAAMTTFGTWIPIIAVVVAAVVVIGLLVTYLGGGLGRRGM